MVKQVNKFNTEKTRAMFLCAFFGVAGVHEFYQKKYVKGGLFALLCLLGIVGSKAQILELAICLPVAIIASFVSQIRMIVNKKNSDAEFCLGVIFFLLQMAFISFRPTFYQEQKTITNKTQNGVGTQNFQFRI